MAVIRVTECVYQPLIDRCILCVDVFDGPEESRIYTVVASSADIRTEPLMKAYIEKNILSQRTALPNWTGSSWKSTILNEQD